LGTIPHDLTGQRFTRLTVIAPAPSRGRGRRWLCRCDCGATKNVSAANLKSGNNLSCGCLRREQSSQRGKYGYSMWASSEYKSWCGMRERCYDKTALRYSDYGERGIEMCERWRNSFENFYADMGPRPSPGHTLDRIDNDGPYSPDNCRWATEREQSRNKRNNRWITHEGETMCLQDWAERTGIPAPTLHQRLGKLGWPVGRALTQPIRGCRR
jgi:hypothetical protein